MQVSREKIEQEVRRYVYNKEDLIEEVKGCESDFQKITTLINYTFAPLSDIGELFVDIIDGIDDLDNYDLDKEIKFTLDDNNEWKWKIVKAFYKSPEDFKSWEQVVDNIKEIIDNIISNIKENKDND